MQTNRSLTPWPGVHPDRTAGRHRHHRRPHLLAPAGGPVGPGSRPRAQCVNNLKQIGLGVHNYISTNDVFPWGCYRQHNIGDPLGYPPTSGGSFVALLPQMEQNQVYNAINFMGNMFGAENFTVNGTSLSYLHCPSDPAIENKVTLGAPVAPA